MAVVGQVLLTPESGWRRYDDTHSLFNYVGTWGKEAQPTAYLGSQAYSHTKGDYVNFCFKGTKLRLMVSHYYTMSTEMPIYIDGVEYKYDAYLATGVTFNVLSFEIENLDNKIHTVKLTHPADKSVLILDAIDIDADGELIRHDYFENTHLDEPLRKYGVAWFGFDETSGNVYDKLGSDYVGTVTGATRVSGWNGEGSAMSFNGTNQYVDFNNSTIPFGEKSISFKIKVSKKPTENKYVFENGATTSQNGICCLIDQNGLISIASTKGTNGIYRFIIYSKISICDDKWHDILFTWNGTTNENEIKLYIDDIFIPNNNGTANTIETLNSSRNLTLGRVYASNKYSNYFEGQIDDLQIYSKALTPADFTKTNIAIKTQDNKNLVLPVRQGRVKEITSSEETDLINQGYTWREIDNAVDGGIDLTQTTTEYETVSKTQTSLGSNKVFTIPLVNDFKTIKIENNF